MDATIPPDAPCPDCGMDHEPCGLREPLPGERLKALAVRFPPPQSWYDADMETPFEE